LDDIHNAIKNYRHVKKNGHYAHELVDNDCNY